MGPPTDDPVTGAEVVALRQTIETLMVPRAEFERHRRNVRLALAAVGVSLVLMLLSVLANRDVIHHEAEQTDLLIGCTTPAPTPPDDLDHSCYDAAQQRTQAAITEITTQVSRDLGHQLDETVTRVLRSFGLEPIEVTATPSEN